MKRKPILCLDFDGVCHSYTTPWRGTTDIPDPPVAGLEQFLEDALRHFEVHIYSSRSSVPCGITAMKLWFYKWVREDVRNELVFPNSKPPAFLTIDDRAIQFTGQWPDPAILVQFKPWNKQ